MAPTTTQEIPADLPAEESCEFDLEATCIPPPGSQTCNATPPPVQQCTGRPFEMGFLYNGGDCNQSYNVQGEQGLFFCSDLNGGPPTVRGEKSFIVVTDIKGEGIVYHSDWVEVGQSFTLSDAGNRFEANQLITIYNSSNTNNPNNIIQSLQYHSSCSSNLFLKDRFGAVQLIQWVNEDQGVISCFANQTFDLDITVPISIEGGPATITSLTVASNVDPFFFNFTDEIGGTFLSAGETLSTSIDVPLDLTHRKTYNFLITVLALTANGQTCRGTDLQSFTAGAPLPPLFPSAAPSLAPAGTSPPTPDPKTAPCNLDADIECRTSTGRGCRSMDTSSDRVCDSQEDPQSLTFIYTGNSCLVGADTTSNGECREVISGLNLTQDEVYIRIKSEDKKDEVLLDQVVSRGDSFVLEGRGLGDDIEVKISSVDPDTGGPGTELQKTKDLKTKCRGREMTLLQGK